MLDIDAKLRDKVSHFVSDCDDSGYSVMMIVSSDTHTEYRMSFAAQTGLIDAGNGMVRLCIKEMDFPNYDEAHKCAEITAGTLVHWRNIMRPLAGLFTSLLQKLAMHVKITEDQMGKVVKP